MPNFSLPKMPRFSPIFLLLIFIILILLVEGIYYWRVRKPLTVQEFPVVQPGEYVAVENIDVFSFPNSNKPFGYLGATKRFTVLNQTSEWLNIKNEKGFTAWIKIDETAYKLVEEE